MEIDDHPEWAQMVDDCMASGRRGAELTRQLLACSRNQSLRPATADANALVSDMIELLRRTLGEDIGIETAFDEDLPPITVDAATLQDAILNLAMNAHAAMPDGGTTVLVVEDAPEVRKVAVRTLRRLGHPVLEAGDGPSALRILKENQNVRLVFSDVVMPGGMSGVELAAEVRRRHEGVKVILTSGYPSPAVPKDGFEQFRFLKKPYGELELFAAINAVFLDDDADSFGGDA